MSERDAPLGERVATVEVRLDRTARSEDMTRLEERMTALERRLDDRAGEWDRHYASKEDLANAKLATLRSLWTWGLSIFVALATIVGNAIVRFWGG